MADAILSTLHLLTYQTLTITSCIGHYHFTNEETVRQYYFFQGHTANK